MAKQRTVFICQQCGAESPKWMGRCPNCNQWNTLVETVVPGTTHGGESKLESAVTPQKLSQVRSAGLQRIKTGIEEFDRVLGGGIVLGSVVLVAGEPGIGKSTLMLQLAHHISLMKQISPISVFYVSGEESPQQIKMRAERMGVKGENVLMIAQTDVDTIIASIKNSLDSQQSIVIIDSIQTLNTEDLSGAAGSVGQIRECTSRLLTFAKASGTPVFLIGHVTKEGAIAGPKVLEHMVDTVIYFEGDRYGFSRLIRATKNRFGATDEVGVFQMSDKGLGEVADPSKMFLENKGRPQPGSVIVSTMEGTRIILAEIQALVIPTQLAIPRRIGQGIEYNRLQLITAILSKGANLPLGGFDIYVNVAGGLKIDEPAADLGVALAIYSSFKNLPLPSKTVVFGELGLLGELRTVGQASKRTKEARRMGFSHIVGPENYRSIRQVIRVIGDRK